MTGQNFRKISKHQAAAFTAQENNSHQRQPHRLAVSMVGDCWIAVCPIYAALRAHFGPQYRLMHLLVFHAYQRQEVISLARLSSSHYHNHKSKENILKFNVTQARSHAHCKVHHTCEIRNS